MSKNAKVRLISAAIVVSIFVISFAAALISGVIVRAMGDFPIPSDVVAIQFVVFAVVFTVVSLFTITKSQTVYNF